MTRLLLALVVLAVSITASGCGRAGRDASDTHTAEAAVIYTCPMHPSVRQNTPGSCPICGMDLTAVNADDETDGVIVVEPARRQEIGIRTAPVTRAPLHGTIRANARLTWEETRLTDVTLKVSGWITRLDVASAGDPVRKGERLFSLYSPELHAAGEEYRLALRSRSDYLVDAARRKLELLDVTERQLAAIAEAAEPLREIPFLSPVAGFVVEKEVVAGQAVQAGARLFRLAPADPVRVDADVYEPDLASITVGQAARVSLPAFPGREWNAVVDFVYPTVDPATRTARVRLRLPNPSGDLRPGMIADVHFSVAGGTAALTVPASAVLYTGPRRIVFVDLGEGRLKPVEVTLGARYGDRHEVLAGLDEGDRVVTSGQFLIAAESRIRSAETFWSSEHEHH